MKVVKAEEVMEPQTEAQVESTSNQTIDSAKVAELQEKFDRERQLIETKKYGIVLDKEQTTFLFEDFYQNVAWKGYESYAIAETNLQLEALRTEKGMDGKISPEIVEAIFHFLKNYMGTGTKTATLFKQICDQFALPMKEINEDRQALRDLSLELIAAEQGIPVEQVVDQLNKQQAFAQGRQG